MWLRPLRGEVCIPFHTTDTAHSAGSCVNHCLSLLTCMRPCTECLYSSVYRAFPVLYFLHHCREIGVFISSIFGKNMSLYWFLVAESYYIALNEPILSSIVLSTMYHDSRIVVKTYRFAPILHDCCWLTTGRTSYRLQEIEFAEFLLN